MTTSIQANLQRQKLAAAGADMAMLGLQRGDANAIFAGALLGLVANATDDQGVAILQRLLSAMGHDVAADGSGVFGTQTGRALNDFQRANDLPTGFEEHAVGVNAPTQSFFQDMVRSSQSGLSFSVIAAHGKALNVGQAPTTDATTSSTATAATDAPAVEKPVEQKVVASTERVAASRSKNAENEKAAQQSVTKQLETKLPSTSTSTTVDALTALQQQSAAHVAELKAQITSLQTHTKELEGTIQDLQGKLAKTEGDAEKLGLLQHDHALLQETVTCLNEQVQALQSSQSPDKTTAPAPAPVPTGGSEALGVTTDAMVAAADVSHGEIDKTPMELAADAQAIFNATVKRVDDEEAVYAVLERYQGKNGQANRDELARVYLLNHGDELRSLITRDFGKTANSAMAAYLDGDVMGARVLRASYAVDRPGHRSNRSSLHSLLAAAAPEEREAFAAAFRARFPHLSKADAERFEALVRL